MSRYRSLVRRLGHTRWFAALGPRLMPVDRLITRISKGRWSIVGRHRLPSLLLITIGRRTGQPRTHPLLYARDGDAYVVAGSNFGQPHHPAWTGNLLVRPQATVVVDGSPVPVVATLATDADRERLWQQLTRVWPAYRTYQGWISGRDIRVFRLVPAETTD